MRPILFEVLGEPVPAYMTFFILGFTLAVWLVRREAERYGMPGHKVVDLGILMLVCGVLGARLLSVLTDGLLMDFVHLCTDPKLVAAADDPFKVCTGARAPAFGVAEADAAIRGWAANLECNHHYLCNLDSNACYPPRDCLAAFKFWTGGLTYYGGLILALPVGFWYAGRIKVDRWHIADITAPFIMVGLAFGRLGCFFSGCCYGGPTDGFTGVEFPPHRTRPDGPLHPTQLYEAAAVLAIFAVLYYVVRPRKTAHGEVLGAMMVGYGAWRFVIEYWRFDPRGALGPLSTSQLVSIPLVLAGAAFVWWRRTRAVR